jgi:hypothetical protein
MLLALAFLVLIEQQSPGLTPSVKLAYVTAYDEQLALRDTLFSYPLLQSPSAAIADGGDLILGEGQQLVRHDRFGVATKIGLPLNGVPTALAFGERHDLFAAFTDEITRVDATSGAVVRHVVLGERNYPPADFDLDAGGCVAFIAFDNRLARIDLCADVPRLETIATDGIFSALRILPDGRLLVASREALEVRGRDGALLARYGVPATKLALDPGGTTAIVFDGIALRRVDLATGAVIAGPAPLQRGVYLRGMAVAGEWRAANPRRRRASHP